MPHLSNFPSCCVGKTASGFGHNWDNMSKVEPSEIEHLSRSQDVYTLDSAKGEFAVAALKKRQYEVNKTTFDAEGWVQVTQWMGGRIALFVRRNGGARYRNHIRFRS